MTHFFGVLPCRESCKFFTDIFFIDILLITYYAISANVRNIKRNSSRHQSEIC